MDVPSNFMINNVRKPDNLEKRLVVMLKRCLYYFFLMKIENPVNGV